MKSLAYRIGYVIGFVTTVLVVAGFVFLLATWALWVR